MSRWNIQARIVSSRGISDGTSSRSFLDQNLSSQHWYVSSVSRPTDVSMIELWPSTDAPGPWNVDKLGRICLDILKDKWSPALQIRTVLLSVQALLSAPNPVCLLIVTLSPLARLAGSWRDRRLTLHLCYPWFPLHHRTIHWQTTSLLIGKRTRKMR